MPIYKNLKRVVASTFVLFLFTGCQLVPQQQVSSNYTQNTSSLGGYYLWVKSLNEQELVEEISHQQKQLDAGGELAQLHLLMLHSLPKSPIHNPYTAKSILNQQPMDSISNQLSVADFSFVLMLKDQLNQQLLVLNKLIINEKVSTEHKKQLSLQQQSIEALQAQSNKLQAQIEQLKRIESQINSREL